VLLASQAAGKAAMARSAPQASLAPGGGQDMPATRINDIGDLYIFLPEQCFFNKNTSINSFSNWLSLPNKEIILIDYYAQKFF